ncbi:MAG TPA: hypothetical protein VLQ46_13920, partial [Casimicrobiaceae bacterium]|nr:hypothetical protein [Casimicrobiaceae bacterium]
PGAARTPATPAAPATPPIARSAPSLLRDLVKCVLLEPGLVRKVPNVPKPDDAGEEGATLAALVEFCTSAETLITAGVMQHFAGTPHEAVLVDALTAAETEGLSAESVEIQFREGVQHYWTTRRRRGASDSAAGVPLSAEEAERARQRSLVQERLAGRA